jgi:hypothetical protein
MKAPTKKCGLCGTPKEIHFFANCEWVRRLDCNRRCRACLSPKKKPEAVKHSGREVWRRDMRGLFA